MGQKLTHRCSNSAIQLVNLIQDSKLYHCVGSITPEFALLARVTSFSRRRLHRALPHILHDVPAKRNVLTIGARWHRTNQGE
jgi:hypothetical protein